MKIKQLSSVNDIDFETIRCGRYYVVCFNDKTIHDLFYKTPKAIKFMLKKKTNILVKVVSEVDENVE